jgi:lysophospholipase L1-like esterase
VVPGTDRVVTFGGQDSVTIPVGDEVVSDPVAMRVGEEQDLVISEFLPQATGPTTWHFEAESTSYISQPGDWTAEPGGSPYQTEIPSWFYLDGVDVSRGPVAGTVVAFGDSITDGHYSTIDANGRWPNWLALRIPRDAVINEGIGGNQILTDTPSSGVSALHRFGRDVLDQLGVTDVIFLEGINDIGVANTTGPYVSATQIEDGMMTIINEAHAHGLKIFGGTLTPFEGASYYNAAGEAEREAVNHWIRTSGAFDGVVDFDAAVRDPSDPLRLNPIYDTGGGHLHPNDLGYKAMADAINLELLKDHR